MIKIGGDNIKNNAIKINPRTRQIYIDMTYDLNMGEYYGELMLNSIDQLKLLNKPIRYQYCIKTRNKETNEIQYDYDIVRNKAFTCYKGTDNFGELGIYDKDNNAFYII